MFLKRFCRERKRMWLGLILVLLFERGLEIYEANEEMWCGAFGFCFEVREQSNFKDGKMPSEIWWWSEAAEFFLRGIGWEKLGWWLIQIRSFAIERIAFAKSLIHSRWHVVFACCRIPGKRLVVRVRKYKSILCYEIGLGDFDFFYEWVFYGFAELLKFGDWM